MALPTTLEVRNYLSDYPLKNLKYDDEVFSDTDIERASYWAGKMLDTIPPFRDMGVADVPDYIMLDGILAQLFKMKYLNLSNNYAPGIIENGLNIREGELAPIYENLWKTFENSFAGQVSNYKKASGLRGSLTKIRSPYNSITRRDNDRNPAP